MRLLIVRHGDPDYVHDCLTPTGIKEAELLGKRLAGEKIDRVYVSPLGRAQMTAAPALKALHMEAQVLDWLEEVPVSLDINEDDKLIRSYPDTRVRADGTFEDRIIWDCLPSCWMNDDVFYERDGWMNSPQGDHSNIKECVERANAGLDALLAENGYVRSGNIYTTKRGSEDTILLVCHFGITCLMLSHLWGISPMILWHCLVTRTTSVTELYTEERRKGEVLFRATCIGDTSHLTEGGMTPSFQARFCETYENTSQRH